MLATLARLIRPSTSASRLPNPLLAQVVDTVGGGIAEARDFRALLEPALAASGDYFARQIAGIPGPMPLSAAQFGQDARIAALFPEADEIGRALGRSLEVKESLPGLARSGHAHVHALLGMRCKPGSEALAVPFSDHTLRSLAPKEADARSYLAFVATKRLLNDFAEHVNKLRRRERLFKLEWNIRNEAVDPATVDPGEYVLAADELTPDKLLRGLIGWLEAPEKYFRLGAGGAFLPGDPAAGAAPGELPQLHCSDRRQWLVCLVRFPVDEGLQALAQESHTHRHIFI